MPRGLIETLQAEISPAHGGDVLSSKDAIAAAPRTFLEHHEVAFCLEVSVAAVEREIKRKKCRFEITYCGRSRKITAASLREVLGNEDRDVGLAFLDLIVRRRFRVPRASAKTMQAPSPYSYLAFLGSGS